MLPFGEGILVGSPQPTTCLSDTTIQLHMLYALWVKSSPNFFTLFLQTGQLPDLVATSGDYLRLWRVTDSDVRQECMLNNVSTGACECCVCVCVDTYISFDGEKAIWLDIAQVCSHIQRSKLHAVIGQIPCVLLQ